MVPAGASRALARLRDIGAHLPLTLARAFQILVFGGWLAAVVGAAAWLGGGGIGGLGRMFENLVMLGASLFSALPLSFFVSLPLLALIAVVRHFWKAIPEEVYTWVHMALIPLIVLMMMSLAYGSDVPIDIHALAYWSLVFGWIAAGFGSLFFTFDVIDWFEPPRPAPTPTPIRYRPRGWDVPPPSETFWSPTGVTGWRGWTWNGTTLRGMRQDWPASQLTADCPYGCSRSPEWDCTCGIYATIDRARADHGDIAGIVELTGRVIEHEHGFRAEHARILTLYAPWHIAAELANAYPDVEVITT